MLSTYFLQLIRLLSIQHRKRRTAWKTTNATRLCAKSSTNKIKCAAWEPQQSPRKLCTNISKHIPACSMGSVGVAIKYSSTPGQPLQKKNTTWARQHSPWKQRTKNSKQIATHSAERVQFNIECNSHDGNYAPELPNIFQHTAQWEQQLQYLIQPWRHPWS